MHFWVVIILFAVSLFGLIGFIWQLSNIRGTSLRGRKKKYSAKQSSYQGQNRRLSDEKQFNRHEKSMHKKALKQIAKGNVIAGATILESIGLIREAISSLEENGYIHDAVKILLRLGIPNRAGVVYARHKLWDDAANCFKMAEMPLEQAKCLEKSGNFETAGNIYSVAKEYTAAADCFEKCFNFVNAANLYFKAKNFGKALTTIKRIQNYENSKIKLSPDLVSFLAKNLDTKFCNQASVGVLSSHNMIVTCITSLVKYKKFDVIKLCLSLSDSKTAKKVINEINTKGGDTTELARVFAELELHREAGVLYQRQNEFLSAAEEFRKAKEFDRAAYCYERAGKLDKANIIRKKHIEGESAIKKTTVDGVPLIDDGAEKVKEKAQEQQDEPGSNQVKSTQPIQNADQGSSSFNESIEEKTVLVKVNPDESDEEVNPEELAKIQNNKSTFFESPLLAGLSIKQVGMLWDLRSAKSFDAGQTIISEKLPCDGIYFIVSGVISASTNNKEARELGEGSNFGEEFFISQPTVKMTYTTKTRCETNFISFNTLKKALASDAMLTQAVYEAITQSILEQQGLVQPLAKSS